MINYLDDYLKVATTPAKRAVLLDVALVLESVIGQNVQISIDEILHDPDSIDYNKTVDNIYESLMASMEVAYNQFGIYFDEELISPGHLKMLADVLESLCQLELNEDKDYLLNLIESSDDLTEALVSLIEAISPGVSMDFEEIIYRIDPQLIIALKNALREPARREPTPDFDEKAAEAYIKRCQEFRKKYGRPPLINDLLEHRANLRHHPDHTIGLISKSLDTVNAKQTAWELLALVTYSNCTTEEIGSYVTKLIEKVCADPADVSAVQDEYQKLLGR